MERDEWGKLLFYAFGLAEGGGVITGATYSTLTNVAILAFLLLLLPFVIGYLAASFGLAYGLVLGVAPAVFAISNLPIVFLGLSQVACAVIMFIVYILISGAAGFFGQSLALRGEVKN